MLFSIWLVWQQEIAVTKNERIQPIYTSCEIKVTPLRWHASCSFRSHSFWLHSSLRYRAGDHTENWIDNLSSAVNASESTIAKFINLNNCCRVFRIIESCFNQKSLNITAFHVFAKSTKLCWFNVELVSSWAETVLSAWYRLTATLNLNLRPLEQQSTDVIDR